jgi:hypothetical protein
MAPAPAAQHASFSTLATVTQSATGPACFGSSGLGTAERGASAVPGLGPSSAIMDRSHGTQDSDAAVFFSLPMIPFFVPVCLPACLPARCLCACPVCCLLPTSDRQRVPAPSTAAMEVEGSAEPASVASSSSGSAGVSGDSIFHHQEIGSSGLSSGFSNADRSSSGLSSGFSNADRSSCGGGAPRGAPAVSGLGSSLAVMARSHGRHDARCVLLSACLSDCLSVCLTAAGAPPSSSGRTRCHCRHRSQQSAQHLRPRCQLCRNCLCLQHQHHQHLHRHHLRQECQISM